MGNEKDLVQLEKDIKKRMTTVMIASLAAIEEKILNNPDFSSLRDDLTLLYDNYIRQEILSIGNNQIRSMCDEIKKYNVERKEDGRLITFKVRTRDGN